MTNIKFPIHAPEHNCDEFNCESRESCCAYFDTYVCCFEPIREVTPDFCNKECPFLKYIGGSVKLDYRYWFKNQVKKLSPEVRRNFDSLWKQVCKRGLQCEVYEWTYDNFKDAEGSSHEFEEKFMRAVNWAMGEWNLL